MQKLFMYSGEIIIVTSLLFLMMFIISIFAFIDLSNLEKENIKLRSIINDHTVTCTQLMKDPFIVGMPKRKGE